MILDFIIQDTIWRMVWNLIAITGILFFIYKILMEFTPLGYRK
jgi:hypothetical protein